MINELVLLENRQTIVTFDSICFKIKQIADENSHLIEINHKQPLKLIFFFITSNKCKNEQKSVSFSKSANRYLIDSCV